VANLLVLYSLRANSWKLTDFGISAEATSKREHTTRYSRGTESYRAPELLQEPQRFTNKVDIWALGCVMFELVTFQRAFSEAWAIRRYSLDLNEIIHVSFSVPSCPDFVQEHVSGNIHDLLNREANRRPRASEIRRIFSAYCQFLELFDAQDLAAAMLNVHNPPLYKEWRALVRREPDDRELLYSLAEQYENKKEVNAATALRKALIEGDAKVKYNAALAKGRSKPPFSEFIADTYMERKDYGKALVAYGTAIAQEPFNFGLWFKLSRAHLVQNDVDVAMRACMEGASAYPTSPSPNLVLYCLYAVKYEYQNAVDIFYKFSLQCRSFDREDLYKKLNLTFPPVSDACTSSW
jgi:serine/threonine protein kinase